MSGNGGIGGGDTPENRQRVEQQIRLSEKEEQKIKEEVHQILQKRAAERGYERRANNSRRG